MSEFTTLSRKALLEHKRRQDEDGYEFALAATSIGLSEPIKARLKRLSLVDRAAIAQLPEDVQAIVWAGIRENQKEQKRIADEGGDPESLLEAVTNNQRMLKAADPICIASFIEPKLVATERELADTPDAWVVTDIAEEDRLVVFMMTNDAESEFAKRLKLFRPRSTPDVPDRETVPVAPTPIVDLGAVPPPVQFNPVS